MVGFMRPKHSLPMRIVASVVIALVLVIAQSSSPAQAAPQTGYQRLAVVGYQSFVPQLHHGATGSISVGGGAQQSGDGFIFPMASGSYDNAGVTNVSFSGSVHFTGHAGQLDMTISNLRVAMSASS
jgi:hypothetical protein